MEKLQIELMDFEQVIDKITKLEKENLKLKIRNTNLKNNAENWELYYHTLQDALKIVASYVSPDDDHAIIEELKDELFDNETVHWIEDVLEDLVAVR